MKHRKNKAIKKHKGATETVKLKAPPSAAVAAAEEEYKKAPHSFVFHRGKVGKNVVELERDLRRVMQPYTASNLKVRKKNVLKDFVSVAGPLNVTHFMVLTKTDITTNLRVMRLPRGPTITFNIDKYCLSKDVISSLKKHNMEPKQFHHHPLLVMNNFSGEGMHFKLMATMFQNMFPSIDVNKVKLNDIRRCVLLNYNRDTNTVDFRHYNIRVVPVGLSRGVKKLVKAKVPNLGKYDDVAEFLLKGDASESEAEMDGPHNEVELPQDLASRGNMKAAKSAIRLTEIGPRMSMKLVKVEDGLGTGKVLHHEFISKTDQELELQEQRREHRTKLKEDRKKNQQKNVEKKQREKDALRKKTLAGMKSATDKRTQETSSDSEVEDPEYQDVGAESDDSQTAQDIKYFKQEVGQDPDTDLFPKRKGMKRKHGKEKNDANPAVPNKKQKAETPSNSEKKKKKLSKALLKARYSKASNQGDRNQKKDLKFEKKKSNKWKKTSDKTTNAKTTGHAKDGKRHFQKNGNEKTSQRSEKDKRGKDTEKSQKKKKVLTDLDRMKRSKQRKVQRMKAKKEGKRRNRPRKI